MSAGTSQPDEPALRGLWSGAIAASLMSPQQGETNKDNTMTFLQHIEACRALGIDPQPCADAIETAHRNQMVLEAAEATWDEMVEAGFATLRVRKNRWVYRVTEAGRSALLSN